MRQSSHVPVACARGEGLLDNVLAASEEVGMQLYFSRGACSLCPHIVLREAGLEFDLVSVDFASKTTATGENFLAVTPLGLVPVLQLDDRTILTEVAAIVLYIADLVPTSGLAPAPGSMARVRLYERLGFIATEVHKSFAPLFRPDCPDTWKTTVRDQLGQRLSLLDRELATAAYLLGDTFSVADAYLFTVLGWTRFVAIDLAAYPNLSAYVARIKARPAVQAALAAERPSA